MVGGSWGTGQDWGKGASLTGLGTWWRRSHGSSGVSAQRVTGFTITESAGSELPMVVADVSVCIGVAPLFSLEQDLGISSDISQTASPEKSLPCTIP